MFTPTAAPASALTKSPPYNGPPGQPAPHETNPTFASSRNTCSRTSSRHSTHPSGPPPRAPDGRQARRQPGGEGASQQGVPPPAPLLAAAHLTSQPLERGGEGQAAPMVATVERRDQYDAQAREGARRHTST